MCQLPAIKRHAGISLLTSVILALALALRAAAQTPKDEIASEISAGHKERDSGRAKEALVHYEDAQKIAAAAGQQKDEGNAWMLIAATHEEMALPGKTGEQPPDRDQQLQSALTAYRSALKLQTDPAGEALARNNLGFVYVHLKDRRSAVEELRQIPFNKLSAASSRAFYRTNLANVELDNDAKSAFADYQFAVRAAPDYSRASSGAFRAIQAAGLGSQEAANILNVLLQSYLTTQTVQLALNFLETPGPPPKGEQVLDCLVRAWAVSPPALQLGTKQAKGDIGRLAGIQKAYADHPASTNRVTAHLASELLSILTEVWTVPVSDGEAEDRLKYWSGRVHMRSELGQLLNGTATALANPERSEESSRDANSQEAELGRYMEASQALARYITAWYLNRSDTDAAVSAAALIRERPPLDPDQRLSRQLSGYYVGKAGWQILSTILRDSDPGRRNLELTVGDLQNIALLHTYLAMGDREEAELERALQAVHRYEKPQKKHAWKGEEARAEPAPDLYRSLAVGFQKAKPKLSAELFLKAAGQFELLAREEDAVKAARSALETDESLGSVARFVPVYAGSKRLLLILPDEMASQAEKLHAEFATDHTALNIEPTAEKNVFQVRLKSELKAGQIPALVRSGDTAALTTVLPSGRAQRDFGIHPANEGDRFVSGTVKPSTGRVLVQVFPRGAKPGPDDYTQGGTGLIDSFNSMFFVPLPHPLRIGDEIKATAVPRGESAEKPVQLRKKVGFAILSRYNAYLDLGALLSTGPATVRTQTDVRGEFEVALKMWTPDAAWPFWATFRGVRRRHVHTAHWALREFGELSKSSAVYSPGPAVNGTVLHVRMDAEAGLYAPVLTDALTFRMGDRFFTPFAAPIGALRVQVNDAREIHYYPEFGMRLGIFRTPATLRVVQPEPYLRIDAVFGKGDSYRGPINDPTGLQAQNELQIRGESRIPMTPFIAGFSKTVGPWPRDLKVYTGFRFDLISLAKLFRGPAPRPF